MKYWKAVIVAAVFVLGLQHLHIQEIYAKEVVRFHVIANSDAKEDQKLKFAVRDKVGAYVSRLLDRVTTKEETLRVIEEALPAIKKVAEREIAKQGYDYPVTAAIEQVDFPIKEYGQYHLPAGQYTSLQVRIGEADGANWWCVMYPNMCFVDSAYEVVEGKEKEQMYRVFTLYEYKKLVESPNKEIHFKYFTKLEDALY